MKDLIRPGRALAVRLFAVVMLCASASAQAKLTPGEYNLYDLVLLCLQAEGTWHSTDPVGMAGRWEQSGKHIYLYGNYDDGHGNDAMVFSNRHPDIPDHNDGSWTEWRDDMSWHAVAPNAYLYKLSDECYGQSQRDLKPFGSNPLKR